MKKENSTPKEKAEDLLSTFAYVYHHHSVAIRITRRDDNAWLASMACVDEILKIKPLIESLPISETKIAMESYYRFWEEVKTELDNWLEEKYTYPKP